VFEKKEKQIRCVNMVHHIRQNIHLAVFTDDIRIRITGMFCFVFVWNDIRILHILNGLTTLSTLL
jgi:hypothetical protein